jgi:hypothetical protein
MKKKLKRMSYDLPPEDILKVKKLAKVASYDNYGNYKRVTQSQIISLLINK